MFKFVVFLVFQKGKESFVGVSPPFLSHVLRGRSIGIGEFYYVNNNSPSRGKLYQMSTLRRIQSSSSSILTYGRLVLYI